jgi:uncharacterized protein DUF3761/SH3 domain-containing protein
MRRVLRAAAFVALLAPGLLARDFAPPQSVYTTARLRLREAPAVSSSIVATVPRGKRISLFSCSEGWCQASYNFLSGYVSQSYLSSTAPIAAPRASRNGHGYINSRGEWMPSPTWTADGRPPAGASARCRDGSYSFSRSRRGTCSHHGGVAMWL